MASADVTALILQGYTTIDTVQEFIDKRADDLPDLTVQLAAWVADQKISLALLEHLQEQVDRS
jgi:hypothetical protein